MKKLLMIVPLFALIGVGNIYAQDIPQSQVPSVIVNSFQKAFPKAYDIEWEMEGENYKVEFETGLRGNDHKAWYNKAGKLIRHKEEISVRSLPQKVSGKIKNDFPGYRLDDVSKISENGKVVYQLEVKKLKEEWKVVYDSEGNQLSKIPD